MSFSSSNVQQVASPASVATFDVQVLELREGDLAFRGA